MIILFAAGMLVNHFFAQSSAEGDHRSVPAYRLHQRLLKNYHKEIRPVLNPKQKTTVGMYCYLYQIFELDQKKNTIMLSGSFELFWQDDFLLWQPIKFEGLTEIHLAPQNVWIPELSIYYSPGSHKMLNADNALKVNFTGGVRWFLPFTITALCPVDVKYFPFDQQTCTLSFGPWSYTTDYLDFNTLAVDQKDYYDNQEWLLANATFTTLVVNYTYLNSEFNFTFAILALKIQRQSFYYVFNLVIPSAVIVLVSIIGFHMPGTSGQIRDAKYRLGIMTILSMTMLLLSIVDDMPKFSLRKAEGQRGSFSSVPLIGMYYFSLLGIIGVSTVTSSMFVTIEKMARQKRSAPLPIRLLAWSPGFFARQSIPGLRSYNLFDAVGFQHCMKQSTLIFQQAFSNGIARLDTVVSWNSGIAKPPSITPIIPALPLLHPHFVSGYTNYDSPRQTAKLTSHYGFASSPAANNYVDVHYATLRPRNTQATNDQLTSSLVIRMREMLNEIAACTRKIEQTISGMRIDAKTAQQSSGQNLQIIAQWAIAINRLECVSLMFYLTLIFVVLYLFFYHDWY